MRITKSIDERINSGEFFLAVLYATLFLLFLVFGLSLHLDHVALPFRICSALADGGVIVMACMWLKGKWRYIGAGLTFALGWLLLANLFYFRNFDDLLQASSYLNANISDPAITDGALSSFKTTDLVFIILPFCPLACLLYGRRKAIHSPVRSGWKLGISAVCVLSWVLSYAGVFRRMCLWYPDATLKDVAGMIFSKDNATWSDVYERHGFTGYAAECIVSCFNIGMDLTQADVDEIRANLSDHTLRQSRLRRESIKAMNGKNLIMIIVESLPYKVLEKPEAIALMPNLAIEAGDSSTIVSRCGILAGYGRSSDAQFIFNTGLLPLRHEALVDNYAFYDYPSIAKALGRTSMEIIGENKNLWNHSLTTKSYGFDSLVDNVAPTGMDQDSIIFKRAEIEIAKLKAPFFLFLTSISMHDPYDSRRVSDESIYSSIKADDPRDREYYARLKHFDRSLGRFLAFLRQEGIFDESVIVIIGDHEIRASKISPELHDDCVPFIIINSPVDGAHGCGSTQLDVFPTILDMMDARSGWLGVEYSGLGRSIFSPEAADGVYMPTDADYRISEMIIKGRPK